MLGYKQFIIKEAKYYSEKHKYIATELDGFYFSASDEKILMKNKIINCTGNLPLFKALTAVRDDSDYMQYFTDAFNDWCFNKNKELSESFKFGINEYEAIKEELMENIKLKNDGY